MAQRSDIGNTGSGVMAITREVTRGKVMYSFKTHEQLVLHHPEINRKPGQFPEMIRTSVVQQG